MKRKRDTTTNVKHAESIERVEKEKKYEAQPPYIAILLTMNLAQLSMVSKENLPKKNLTRSGNLFWMHCKYTNMEIKQNILIYIHRLKINN